MKNDTKKNETQMDQFDDGEKDHNDIPSLLAVGLNYALLDNVRLAIGYHHWFDSKADFSGDLEDHVDDTNEFLYGVEVDFLKRFTISGGVQVTRFGIKDDYISDMNINISSTSFGFGLAYRATDWMRVNLSYAGTIGSVWNVARSRELTPATIVFAASSPRASITRFSLRKSSFSRTSTNAWIPNFWALCAIFTSCASSRILAIRSTASAPQR